MNSAPATGLQTAIGNGMLIAHYAGSWPDRIAIHSMRGDRTFAALNARANQLVRTLRAAGLEPGDGVALICGNTPEFVEVFAAIYRAGFRWTPVNWRLTGAEAAYIVADCRARALIAHHDHAALARSADNDGLAVRLSIGGPIDGFDLYEETLAVEDAADIADPSLGQAMLYTSGTTGKPKGVHRLRPLAIAPQQAGTIEDYRPGTDISLCVGPAYHGGPLGFDVVRPLLSGVPVVLVEKFDEEAVLRAIERYRITHLHLVATMMIRLLRLPEETRRRYDLSSLRVVFHGAAPTPPEIKRAMIDWWGPIFTEYYAATEGGAVPQIRIASAEWLKHQGSVGHIPGDGSLRIGDDAGNPLPAGETGNIWFRDNPDFPFEYFGDPEKTRASFAGDYFRVGDMGYVDSEGYLFLTGRSAECIISGGVNIYPQEIDDVLIEHPAVGAVCTVGVPNAEWGEEVRAVIVPRPGFTPGAALIEQLTAFARTRLAGFKVPRGIDFVDELIYSDSGKIQRNLVRERYWKGIERKI